MRRESLPKSFLLTRVDLITPSEDRACIFGKEAVDRLRFHKPIPLAPLEPVMPPPPGSEDEDVPALASGKAGEPISFTFRYISQRK